MTTWQSLRNWKYYLEFVAGLSILMTAAFFIQAMNQNRTLLDGQRSSDAVISQMEQAESQLASLEEPGLTVMSTFSLENLGNTYLGPLVDMRPAMKKNQSRINGVLSEAEAISSQKSDLLTQMTSMEVFILNTKSTGESVMSSSDITYLATVSAWLTNLKSAMLTGNLDATSLTKLNQLTGNMQGESEFVSESFPAQIVNALGLLMSNTQNFIDSRNAYQAQHANAMASLTGMKNATSLSAQKWASTMNQNQMVLWFACFFGMAISAGLFLRIFSTKHFATMLVETPDEARLIENSEFIHQVDELLNVVDQNWLDSRKESTILNETVLVNEDMKKNIHQLEHDIKMRNTHEQGQFESVITRIKQLRLKAEKKQIDANDIYDLEKVLVSMRENLLLDNKSVNDDLSGVENTLYTLNTDMQKLQSVMNRVIQDSRNLIKLRNEIEETESIAQSV